MFLSRWVPDFSRVKPDELQAVERMLDVHGIARTDYQGRPLDCKDRVAVLLGERARDKLILDEAQLRVLQLKEEVVRLKQIATMTIHPAAAGPAQQ